MWAQARHSYVHAVVIFYIFLEGSDNMLELNGVVIAPHALDWPVDKLNLMKAPNTLHNI